MNIKLIYALAGFVALGLIVAATALLLNANDPFHTNKPTEQSKPTASEIAKLKDDGTNAENKGDTKAAISSYEKARTACETTGDKMCVADMTDKITLLQKSDAAAKKADSTTVNEAPGVDYSTQPDLQNYDPTSN